MGLSSVAREVAVAAPSREGCAERRRRWQKAGAAALGLGRGDRLERSGAAAQRRCTGAVAVVVWCGGGTVEMRWRGSVVWRQYGRWSTRVAAYGW
jgi:hypothetical protein